MKFGLRLEVVSLSLLGRTVADQGAGPESCTATPIAGGALELLQMSNCTVYVGQYDPTKRPNVLHQYEKWEDPSNGWSLNNAGVRYSTTSSSCLYASPGEAELKTVKIDTNEPWAADDAGSIQWTHLASICATKLILGGCFPEACDGANPRPGSLKFFQINKCHKLVWKAGLPVAKMKDPDGNEYIMHACSDEAAAKAGKPFGNPKMPEGWVYRTEVLSEDFVLSPENPYSLSKPDKPVDGARLDFTELSCGYALLLDCEGNGYHRFKTTTGNKVVEGKLKLILRVTPSELMFYIQLFGFIAVILIAGCIYMRCTSEKHDGQPAQVELVES